MRLHDPAAVAAAMLCAGLSIAAVANSRDVPISRRPMVPDPTSLRGSTYYVDDDAPGDAGPRDEAVSDPLEDGTAGHPFDRVQEALTLCTARDSVLLAPGTFTGDLTLYSDGCRIAGSGSGVSSLEQVSMTLGFSAAQSYDFVLESVTLLSGSLVPRQPNFGSPVAGNLRLTDVVVQDCALDLTALPDEVVSATLQNVTMEGGSISVFSEIYGFTSLLASDLVAPSTPLILGGTVTSGSIIDVSRSVLKGIEAGFSFEWFPTIRLAHVELMETGFECLAGLGSQLQADLDHVWFHGKGIVCGGSSLNITPGIHLAVSDSVFERGGISLDQGDGSLFASITGCSFQDDGINVLAQAPEAGHGFNGGTIWMTVDSSRFVAAGIEAHFSRGFGTEELRTDIQLTNNLFLGPRFGVSTSYEFLDFEPPDSQGRLRANLRVVNNTFVGNSSAIDISTGAHPAGIDAMDTLIKNNIVTGGREGIRIVGRDQHDVRIENNDVRAAPDGRYRGDIGDQTGRNGNISLPPWLKGPSDFRLQSISPCIDRGGFGPEVPGMDFLGRTRPLDGNGDGYSAPDMGAHEFPGLPDGGRSRKN